MALASRAPEGERAEREEEALRREIRSLAHDDTEQEWLWRIAGRMRVAASLDEEAVRAEQEELIARRDRLLAPPRRAARGSRRPVLAAMRPRWSSATWSARSAATRRGCCRYRPSSAAW